MSTQIAQKPKFSVAIRTEGYQRLINNTLQDPKRAQRFIASVSSAVAVNPDLQACDAGTILSCALLGESLELSPSPQLGQYYMVPFKDKATFILGYKGYIQLAIRSGQYKKLNVLAVKEGELIRFDPLNEEIEVNLIQNELEREVAPTIGYYAMFEYTNGFRKALYWSRDKMEAHAQRYSAGYASDKAKGNRYTFWSKDFDGMAYKTMLRQLISKWGVMSIEMRQALESDDGIVNTDGTNEFVGNAEVDVPPMISANTTEAVVADGTVSAEPISMSDL